MVIGTLRASLFLRDAHSLKDKRQVLKALKDRVHNEFNVSIAEIEDQDLWQKVSVGVAVVSNDSKHALSVLSSVERFLKMFPPLEFCESETEIL